MAANDSQPLKLKRMLVLLDRLIEQANQIVQTEDFESSARQLDFRSVPVVVQYLREFGLAADAKRLQGEFAELFVKMTDVVFSDVAKSDPELQEFFRVTYRIPQAASDPEAHAEIQDARIMVSRGKAIGLSELLTDLRGTLMNREPSGRKQRKVKRKRRGRPNVSDEEANKRKDWVRRWKSWKSQYPTITNPMKRFCEGETALERKIDPETLSKYVNWDTQVRTRKARNRG